MLKHGMFLFQPFVVIQVCTILEFADAFAVKSNLTAFI